MKTLLVAALAVLIGGAAMADDGFFLPDDDLPEARVGAYRVAFLRNGTFAVARDGRWLLDGGLGFATPGWAEWGTQVRRSAAGDSWESADEGKTLVTRGTMFDIKRKPRFRLVQRASLIPNGLRFEYVITPLESKPLLGLGLVLHFPIAETKGGIVKFPPADRQSVLPAEQKKPGVASAKSPSMTLDLGEGRQVSVTMERPAAWAVTDDRTWNEEMFRFIGWDAEATAAAARGETARLKFDLMLAGEVAEKALEKPRVAPASIVTVLPDDETTRGDWRGVYGKRAYVLCGMRAPKSLSFPVDGSWKVRGVVGSDKDVLRAWRSSAPAVQDRTVLWEPDGSKRTPSAWDDHGEAHPLGTGPDLLLRVPVPAGAHQLSLYFFEVDWPQFRSHTITITTDDEEKRLLAETRVDNFLKGKYKRLAVRGPANLRILIARDRSSNAVVSGIFLDALPQGK